MLEQARGRHLPPHQSLLPSPRQPPLLLPLAPLQHHTQQMPRLQQLRRSPRQPPCQLPRHRSSMPSRTTSHTTSRMPNQSGLPSQLTRACSMLQWWPHLHHPRHQGLQLRPCSHSVQLPVMWRAWSATSPALQGLHLQQWRCPSSPLGKAAAPRSQQRLHHPCLRQLPQSTCTVRWSRQPMCPCLMRMRQRQLAASLLRPLLQHQVAGTLPSCRRARQH
mmetsp:Transcript_26749/g.68132  ORF Transcript_26749/g.68132 Transcript_26749/m.68132 type:complete len:219 (-) Transcript_26749:162-818(-)